MEEGKKHTLESKVLYSETFVGTAVVGNHRSAGNERVVNTRERNQVGLKFGQIDIEGTIETKTGSYRADHLSDEAVQVLVAGTWNVELTMADIVNSFVINKEGAIGVLNCAMCGQNSIVRFNHRGRHTRGGIDGEFKL